MNFQAWVSAWLLCLILAFVLCAGLAGCAGQPVKQPQTCLMDVKNDVCWIDKASGQKFEFEQMDGFFAMPAEDLTNILGRLNQCHAE